jgi:hypothetical protein
MSLRTDDWVPSDQGGTELCALPHSSSGLPRRLGLWAGPGPVGRSTVTFPAGEPRRPADWTGAP